MSRSGAIVAAGGIDTLDRFVGTVTANVIASAPYATAISETPSDEAVNATTTDAMTAGTTTTGYRSGSVTTGTGLGSAATTSVALPVGVVTGDQMVIVFWWSQTVGGAPTITAGWTLLASSAGYGRLHIFHKTAAPGDTNPVVITADASGTADAKVAVALAIQNAGTPSASVATDQTNGKAASASVATAGSCVVEAMCGGSTATATIVSQHGQLVADIQSAVGGENNGRLKVNVAVLQPVGATQPGEWAFPGSSSVSMAGIATVLPPP